MLLWPWRTVFFTGSLEDRKVLFVHYSLHATRAPLTEILLTIIEILKSHFCDLDVFSLIFIFNTGIELIFWLKYFSGLERIKLRVRTFVLTVTINHFQNDWPCLLPNLVMSWVAGVLCLTSTKSLLRTLNWLSINQFIYYHSFLMIYKVNTKQTPSIPMCSSSREGEEI